LSDSPANPTQIQALPDASLRTAAAGHPTEPVSSDGTADVKRGARDFRPDVAGLRGIAVLLVVLFHAGLSQVSGGFVGVDVFFVISGFVITGVLLREHEKTKGTSLLAFYARRARRILPAGTVVIIVTVLISYRWLGFIAGNQVAQDDKAAALFYANFHFISLSTNYFTSRLPPSPLQHFWSLSVEEQFYLVYPTIFLCVALVWRRQPIVRKLAVVLLVVIGASFVLSVVQTASNANAAYFSPFTRAWELALGALVAIGSRPLSKLPSTLAAALTWAGMACVLLAAFLYTSATAYPGDAVALPVVGAAAIIAGGAAAPAVGAEAVLGRLPLQWLGLISYSLYLWHWPLLVVPEEHATHPLSLEHKLLLALLAVAVSAVSFVLIENPIRKAKKLSRRNVLSLAMGGCLIAASLSVAFIELATHP
jgi:peptidoglycan/LPS O-acetylase OafA/YrhL